MGIDKKIIKNRSEFFKNAFADHLKKTSEKISSWPEWKRNIFGSNTCCLKEEKNIFENIRKKIKKANVEKHEDMLIYFFKEWNQDDNDEWEMIKDEIVDNLVDNILKLERMLDLFADQTGYKL